VKFIFKEPIELQYYMMTFANDAAGRDPIEWFLEITTDKGQKMEDRVNAQTI